MHRPAALVTPVPGPSPCGAPAACAPPDAGDDGITAWSDVRSEPTDVRVDASGAERVGAWHAVALGG